MGNKINFKTLGGVKITLIPYDFLIKGIKQKIIIEINMFYL